MEPLKAGREARRAERLTVYVSKALVPPAQLQPHAREVNRIAGAGISGADIKTLKRILTKLRGNLAAAHEKRVKTKSAP